MSAEHSPQVSLTLTGLAMRLLDVSFEPASGGAGDILDRILEHIADELSQAAAETDVEGAWPPGPIDLPEPDSHLRRREQLLLRNSILQRNHPAVSASIRTCEVRLTESVQELSQLLGKVPDHVSPRISLAAAALASIARTVENYRRSVARLQKACSTSDADLRHQADLAARAERTLVRELRRVGQTTYGFIEASP